METLVTTLHFVVALIMIGLILLQQGKGANMGASFGGGGSNTVFGSSGGATFFGKLTAGLAVIFFVSSLGLTLIAKENAQINSNAVLPVLETVEPTAPESSSGLPTLPVEESAIQAVPALPIDAPQAVEQGGSALESDSVESAAPATE